MAGYYTTQISVRHPPLGRLLHIQWIFVEAANSDRQQEIRFSFYRFYSRSAEFSGVYSLRQ